MSGGRGLENDPPCWRALLWLVAPPRLLTRNGLDALGWIMAIINKLDFYVTAATDPAPSSLEPSRAE